MKEQQLINGKNIWLTVTPVYPQREHPNIIPAEYFTVAYNLSGEEDGDLTIMQDENGEPKLFESPVAAISYASKELQASL